MDLGYHELLDAFQQDYWTVHRGNTKVAGSELEKIIGPNSMDVTLHNEFLLPVGGEVVNTLDGASVNYRRKLVETSYPLMPGQFLLASTRERVDCTEPIMIDNKRRTFYSNYEGRSTMARLGVMSHITAGLGDYGFNRPYVLEIYNVSPNTITLYPGMRIGQLVFREVYRPKLYAGAYKVQQDDWQTIGPVLGIGRT